MGEIKPKADVLIEVSYEIVAKLGGIHTVIKTKAPFMKKYYGNDYYVIGLYVKKYARKKFKRKEPNKQLKSLFEELKKEKIICHYGVWDVKGSPKAILIDIEKLKRDKETKNKIMEDYWVHFLPNKTYHNNSMIFGYSTGKLISGLVKLKYFKKKKVVVNFHEYMSGLGLLYLRKHKCNIPVVFTTHATTLGRAISLNGGNLYNDILIYKKKSKKTYYERLRFYRKKVGSETYNVHLFEGACARKADVFTTVSETTSKEAGFLLDKPADVITPNGLDILTPPSIEEQFAVNYRGKQKIYRFLDAYFSPYYPINIEYSLLFCTSGRYEIYTKGYDIFFDALKQLNVKLKKEKFSGNIFVFLFIMMGKKKINKNIIKTLNFYKKKKSLALNYQYPPNCLFSSRDNKILSYLKKNGLLNKPKDKVKILFYPAPVKRNDKLLSMHYKQIISAMDLGVFPSLYEPWGYTPLETAAMSTIAITTDVTGFGKFIEKRTDQRTLPGIIVLKTRKKDKGQIATSLARTMHKVVYMSNRTRFGKRMEASNLADLANWGDFSKEYIRAHNLAVKKRKRK